MSDSKINYCLSTDNAKNVPFDKYEKNFTFILNGKRYETSRFVADILSPIVCNWHYKDETLDEFTLNITSKDDSQTSSDDSFQTFLQIINFIPAELDANQCQKYGQYFLQLGNIDEYLRLCPEYFDNLTSNNVIDRLIFITGTIKANRRENEHFKLTEKINMMIEYAAEHFSEIPQEKLKMIEYDILEEIIKNKKLRLDDEDSLLHLIIELYEENRKYSSLFEYVEFEHLKSDSVKEFIDHFDIEYLSSGTWRSICERLIQPCEAPNENQRYFCKCEVFAHKEGDEFKGIMHHLTDQTGGNIHDNGTIEITSNSVYSNYYPRNIIDYQNNNVYQTDNKENSEICFDFKDREIQIASYSLKSCNWGKNTNHLKSWVIEVSNDKKKWEEIDRHENEASLNGPNLIATFNAKEVKSFSRFVRLRQTGLCWNNNYYTVIAAIEFYGKLKHH